MWNQLIEIGNWTETVVNGFPTRTISYKSIYAEKKSVRQSEFYSGMNAGLKPDLVFVVRTIDFSGQEVVKFNGVVYTIIRTYDTGEYTELTVTAQVGDASG